MKRLELFFTFLLIPIDYIMVLGAGMTVYFLRFQSFVTDVRPVVFELSSGEYLQIISIVALLWLPAFALAGMYNLAAERKHIEELGKVFLGCTTGLIVIVFIIFFRHELFGSRFIVLFGWVLSIVFVYLGRLIIRYIQRNLFKKGKGIKRVVIIGQERNARSFIKYIKNDLKSGYKIVRHINQIDKASIGLLANIAKNKSADMIIETDPEISRSDLNYLWRFCQENHLDFSYVADTFEARVGNVKTMELGGVVVLFIKRTPLDGWGRIVKRIIDIVFSLAIIILISPLGFLISLIIKLTSKGSVLVALKRVGESGEMFNLYKFRSMVADAHYMKEDLKKFNERGDGPLFKIKDDPRVTKPGKFLRKYSLDELPNFFNVLRGEMSVVGPRPHEPGEVSNYKNEQKRLLTIKPGVTGLAQISGRSDLSFEEEAKLDMFYIESWNLWQDLKIILRTVWVIINGKNAS